MKQTKIEWCDATWNPVTGCKHGCEYCYARKMAHRFGGAFGQDDNFIGPTWSTEADGSNHILDSPIKDECKDKIAPYPFEFDPTFHRYRLDVPKKWSEPRTIFVCSMADLFGEWVPDEWVEQVFEACAKAPQHRYLFLTKNPERYAELFEKGKLPIRENFWYGTTVDSEGRCSRASLALNGIIHAEDSPNFFISAEPLLGDVTKSDAWVEMCFDNGVKWIIVGAESGTRKCKVVPQKVWIDNIIDDCEYNGISLFMKDSLIPIVGKENMGREFPWERSKSKWNPKSV